MGSFSNRSTHHPDFGIDEMQATVTGIEIKWTGETFGIILLTQWEYQQLLAYVQSQQTKLVPEIEFIRGTPLMVFPTQEAVAEHAEWLKFTGKKPFTYQSYTQKTG